MAYFSNGTSGECFDQQCGQCRFGDSYCPIHWVQVNYNYDACNVPVASAILDDLVKDDGTCAMFQMDPSCFRSDWSKQRILPLDDAETAVASLSERSTDQAIPERAALKAVIRHWNEHGSQGFDETIASAEKVVART